MKFEFTEEQVKLLLHCIEVTEHEFGKTEDKNHLKNILLDRRGGSNYVHDKSSYKNARK